MMDRLKAALDATGYRFAHFGWAQNALERKQDHGVYAEDGQGSLWADGHQVAATIQGTVDYFTRDGSGTPQRVIEAALNGLESCSWYLSSIQVETDTGFLHYEWVFELPSWEVAASG